MVMALTRSRIKVVGVLLTLPLVAVTRKRRPLSLVAPLAGQSKPCMPLPIAPRFNVSTTCPEGASTSTFTLSAGPLRSKPPWPTPLLMSSVLPGTTTSRPTIEAP